MTWDVGSVWEGCGRDVAEGVVKEGVTEVAYG